MGGATSPALPRPVTEEQQYLYVIGTELLMVHDLMTVLVDQAHQQRALLEDIRCAIQPDRKGGRK